MYHAIGADTGLIWLANGAGDFIAGSWIFARARRCHCMWLILWEGVVTYLSVELVDIAGAQGRLRSTILLDCLIIFLKLLCTPFCIPVLTRSARWHALLAYWCILLGCSTLVFIRLVCSSWLISLHVKLDDASLLSWCCYWSRYQVDPSGLLFSHIKLVDALFWASGLTCQTGLSTLLR